MTIRALVMVTGYFHRRRLVKTLTKLWSHSVGLFGRTMGKAYLVAWPDTRNDTRKDGELNNCIVMFLNDVGIWTRVGNKWTTGSWKSFATVTTKVSNTESLLEDRQPIITLHLQPHSIIINSDDQDAYREYLYQASKGYKGSQKKGRPNKVPNRKDTFVTEPVFMSGSNDPSIRPIKKIISCGYKRNMKVKAIKKYQKYIMKNTGI